MRSIRLGISQLPAKRETHYAALCKRLVREGIKRYYTVSVSNGERWAIERSRDEQQIFGAMFVGEIEKLRFRTMVGKFVGDVTLVHSEGENVIYDWTNRYEINQLVAAVKGSNDLPLQGNQV
jgi:hypothetical protein